MAARVLITGGSGLIGRHLVAALADSPFEVLAPGRGELDLLGTADRHRQLARLAPDVVVHLAWCASGTAGYRTSADNERWLAATVDLQAWCAARGVLFHGTGTGIDDKPAGDAYTAAKRTLRERLAPLIAAGEIGWLRPFHVFDPDARRPRLVADVLAAGDRGERPVLGSPDAAHDFVHAADVASAVRAVLAHRLTGVVDIGTGRCRTVAALAAALLGDHRGSASGEPAGMTDDGDSADVRRLAETGWTPTTTEAFFTDV